MKVNYTTGGSNEIRSIAIFPETQQELQLLQKVKRDYDKHVEVDVVDKSIMSEYLRVKITIEFLPAYP
jgi:hypothetical protein